MPVRKSSCFPSPASRASFGSSAAWTAWKNMSGIRGTKTPGDEEGDAVLLCLRGEQLDPQDTRVRQQLREDGSHEQPPERSRDFGIRRLRTGSEQAALPTECEYDRDDRRHGQREPVEPNCPESDDEQHCGEDDPNRCFRAKMKPYRPNRPFPDSVPRAVNDTK